MPKTPVYENNALQFWEDEIGAPGQISGVQTIAKTHSMSDGPYHPFGRGILSANARHVETPLLRSVNIYHVHIVSAVAEYIRPSKTRAHAHLLRLQHHGSLTSCLIRRP